MSLDAKRIITASERIMTLAKRAIVSDDRDTRRQEIVTEFEAMATDLGKIASPAGRPNWGGIVMASYDLHTVAVEADERRCGTFTHLPSEMSLMGKLSVFAAVLGFTLEDAATAPVPAHDVDDTDDMCAVEGHGKLEAAE